MGTVDRFTEKKDKPGIRDGFMTVEAAMLSPVLISSVLMLLFLTAHVHNRTYAYTRAAEQAVSGHEQELQHMFAMGKVDCTRDLTDTERRVGYSLSTLKIGGEVWHSIDEEATYRIYRPIRQLRQINSFKETVGMLFD